MAKSITKIVESISVKEFYESFRDHLQLKVVAGSQGLNKVIKEKSINRPALALIGHFKYFANKRIQLFGAGEMAFMRELSNEKQLDIINEIASKHIPCIVVSRNLAPTAAMRKCADKYKIPLLRTPIKSKDFSADATILLEHKFAPNATVHATLLDIKGVGTLLRGKSGVGKSECALTLIERGHSLVADDTVYIKKLAEREIVGTCSELNRGYMECRGIGIINVAEMFGIRSVRLEKRVDLVVTFREWSEGMVEERTGLEENYFSMLDLDIPHVEIPVRPGRDLARLTEVAALVRALKLMGHHPAQEFNERLIQAMAKSRGD